MTIKNFKCRASSAGDLLTNPKSGSGLSKTTQSYVQIWLKEQIYGYKKQFTSKYTDKGLRYEDEAIDKCIEWLDLPLVLKNQEHFEDEYFTGEPDLILPDRIIDIKNSWDWSTFPLFDEVIPNPEYVAQVQVYMHLTGKLKASVVYMLLTTPETKFEPEMNYDHVPRGYRIKKFDFEYDPEVISKLQGRVMQCREYINQLTNK